jgi:hypothetical protein
VGEETPQKSADIQFIIPKKPFQEHRLPSSDKAWLSTVTANIISFTSECSLKSDPSLETLVHESIESLDHVEILENETINFNNREAIRTFAKGKIDGIPLAMKTLIFKKNGCNYRIMLSGLVNKIDKDQSQFEEFLREFKAP